MIVHKRKEISWGNAIERKKRNKRAARQVGSGAFHQPYNHTTIQENQSPIPRFNPFDPRFVLCCVVLCRIVLLCFVSIAISTLCLLEIQYQMYIITKEKKKRNKKSLYLKVHAAYVTSFLPFFFRSSPSFFASLFRSTRQIDARQI